MAYVLAGFDLNRIGSMSAVLNDGTDNDTSTVTAARYCHKDLTSLSSVLGSGYGAFGTAVTSAWDATLTTTSVVVSQSLSTGVYTLNFNGVTTSVDFTTAAGQRLAQALGFTADHADGAGSGYACTLSGASSYASNVTPYYYLALAKDGVAIYSRPFDLQGQTKVAATTGGKAYVKRPMTKVRMIDFRYSFQALAATFSEEADSTTAPWTYYDLVETCASVGEPIYVNATAVSFVYKDLKPDFSKDRRQNVFEPAHTHWHLDVNGLYMGAI